eukprot:TRINITY_DN7152_c0_g1_i2.p1 TRINITY_DN7152_c0_g1~~TRINITY_DN7152_c0_g1_i2.p1  ORF type:complete len:201 (+),score=24.20 TRINITY_DN7152_c0_g1_i2:71-673(+)
MFGLLYGTYLHFFSKVEYYVLMIGPDQAGKTTLLEYLKHKQKNDQSAFSHTHIMPTVGLNIGRIVSNGVQLNIWDLGGQQDLRTIWEKYYSSCHAIIFVLDSSTPSRLEECSRELESLSSHTSLHNVPILIFANKQDLCDPSSTQHLGDDLELGGLRQDGRQVHVQISQARTGEGVEEGIHWLVNLLKQNARALPSSTNG